MPLIRNPQKQTFLLVNTGKQWSLDKPCRQNIDAGMYRITSTLESTHWRQNPYFYWKPLNALQLKLLLKQKQLKQRGLLNRDNKKSNNINKKQTVNKRCTSGNVLLWKKSSKSSYCRSSKRHLKQLMCSIRGQILSCCTVFTSRITLWCWQAGLLEEFPNSSEI